MPAADYEKKLLADAAIENDLKEYNKLWDDYKAAMADYKAKATYEMAFEIATAAFVVAREAFSKLSGL